MRFSIAAMVLAALLLGGCGSAGAQMDAAGDRAERMLQSVGEAVESAAMNQPTATESTTARLTREQAEAIALENAGFTADQVTGLRTEFEIDDGVPRFEVQFRQGRWEYDYEIHAGTGAILSYDRDD